MYTNRFSACSTTRIRLSAPDRYSMAPKYRLPSLLGRFRKSVLVDWILARIAHDGQFGFWQRIQRVGRAHTCNHQHELDHVLWEPPREPELGRSELPTSKPLHVVRKHRGSTATIPKPTPRPSPQRIPTNSTLSIPHHHRHELGSCTCNDTRTSYLGPFVCPHCIWQSLQLSSTLESLQRGCKFGARWVDPRPSDGWTMVP